MRKIVVTLNGLVEVSPEVFAQLVQLVPLEIDYANNIYKESRESLITNCKSVDEKALPSYTGCTVIPHPAHAASYTPSVTAELSDE